MQTNSIHEEPFEGRPSTELALGTFAIGTLLFTLLMIVEDTLLVLMSGFLFVVFATILNAIMLYHLLYHFYILPMQRRYIRQKILILLSNIPLAFLYLMLLLFFAKSNSPF